MTGGPVGTAYVVIRAITTGLKKDIEDGFDKGVKEADIDKAGDKASEKFSRGVSSGISRRQRTIASSVSQTFNRIGDDVDKNTGSRFAHLGESLSKKLFSALEGDSQSRLKQLDQKIGAGIAKIVAGFNLPPIAWLAILAVPALGAAAKIVSDFLVTIIGQLGFIVTAAVGAGAALGAAFAGLILAVGPLFFLLKTQGPLLEGFKQQISNVAGAWKTLGVQVQSIVFPALTDAFRLITSKMLPAMTVFETSIAKSAGFFARMAAATLTSDENLRHFTKILEGSQKIFDALGRALIDIIDLLLPFLEAAIPLAVRLADGFERLVGHWRDLVKAGSASGKLADTLKLWFDRAQLFLDIVGRFGAVFFKVFSIGADAAAPFFVHLDEIARRWEEFSNSLLGGIAIRSVFENAIPVVKEVSGLLGDIVRLIFRPLVTGDTSGIVSFFHTVREDILPVVAEMAKTITKQLSDDLLNFVSAFAKFLDKLVKTGALGSVLNTISGVLELLTKILEMPITGEIVTHLLGLFGSFSVLNIALGGLPEKAMGSLISFLLFFVQVRFLKGVLQTERMASALEALAPAVTESGDAAGVASVGWSALLAPLGIAAAIIAGLVITALAIWQAMKHWKEIPGWVKILVVALGGLISPAIALAFLGRIIFDNWGKIQKVFEDLGTTLLQFFKDLPNTLEKVGQAVLEFFVGLPDRIGDLINELPNLLGNFGELLAKGITEGLGGLLDIGIKIITKIRDAIGDALPELGKFLAKLPFTMVKFILTGLVEFLGLGTRIIAAIIRGLIKAVPEVVKFFVQFIKDFPDRLNKAISFFETVGLKMLEGLVNGLVKGVPIMAKFFFVTLPKKLLDFTADSGKWLLDTGVQVVAGMLIGLVEGLGDLLGFFVDLPGMIWDSLDPGLQGILADFGKWFFELLTDVGDFVSDVIDFFSGLPDDIVTAIGDLLGTVGGFIGGVWDNITTGVSNFIGDVIGFFSGLPDRIITAIGDLAGQLERFFSDAFGGLFIIVQNAIGDIVDFIGDVPDIIINALGDFGEGIANTVAGGLRAAWNAAMDELNSIANSLPSLTIPNPFGDDIRIGLPESPFDALKLHLGGLVPGKLGEEVLIKALAGEFVINPRMPTRAASLMDRAGVPASTSSVTNIITNVDARGQSDPTRIGIAIARRQRVELSARS